MNREKKNPTAGREQHSRQKQLFRKLTKVKLMQKRDVYNLAYVISKHFTYV